MEQDKLILWAREIEAALNVTNEAYAKRANELIDRVYKAGMRWRYNFAFTLIDILLSALVAQEPYWVANPLNKDGEFIQPVVEKILRYYSIKLRLRQKMRKMILWNLITGISFAKVGYSRMERAEIGEPIERKKGDIYLSIPDPRDIFGDPYGQEDDLSDFRYFGERLRLPLISVKSNPEYDPQVTMKLKADEVANVYPEERRNRLGVYNTSELPEEYALKTIYELFVRKDDERIEFMTFARGVPEPLLAPRLFPPIFNDFPYVCCRFYTVLGKFYGDTVLDQMKPIFEMFNGIMNRIEQSWKNAINKTLVDKTGLDSTERGIEAIRSKAQHNIVFCNRPPREVIEQVQAQLISNDEIQLLNFLMDLFQRLSGITYMDLGRGTSKSATEASTIQSSADRRVASKGSVAEEATATIGARIWRIARYIKDELPVVEILGEEDAAKWDEYEARQTKREKETLDCDISVKMSVAITPAQLNRRNLTLEFIRSICRPEVMQTVMAQGEMPDLRTLIKKVGEDSGIAGSVLLPVQPLLPTKQVEQEENINQEQE